MPDLVRPLFDAIDALDAEGLAALLDDDARFIFGNAAPLHGRDAIHDHIAAFFGRIGAVRHHVAESWNLPGVILCCGEVTYTRRDATTLTVPFATILKTRGERIRDYQVYIDTSRLFV